MGWVTKDQLQRARAIDVLDYVLSKEPDNVRRVGSGYRMKDHPSLSVDGKGWYWHSREIGGKTALDFLTDVRGYGLVDAVCMLIHERPLDRPPANKPGHKQMARKIVPKKEASPPDSKPLTLPPRNANNSRVLAYLQSRGISKPLILDCIELGLLYESARFHNCVFVGRDENGKARFAALRGTLGNYKCDAEGSDKRYGFLLPPYNPDSDTVAVFEAPIDALSHQTLCEQGHIEPYDGWRLSLGGTALAALKHFLEHHTGVTNCLICTDNDEAGERAADEIGKLPGITVVRYLPPTGSDWNEALLAAQKAERLQNRAYHGPERS